MYKCGGFDEPSTTALPPDGNASAPFTTHERVFGANPASRHSIKFGEVYEKSDCTNSRFAVVNPPPGCCGKTSTRLLAESTTNRSLPLNPPATGPARVPALACGKP